MQFCRMSFGGKKIAQREASCFNWNFKKKNRFTNVQVEKNKTVGMTK